MTLVLENMSSVQLFNDSRELTVLNGDNYVIGAIESVHGIDDRYRPAFVLLR